MATATKKKAYKATPASSPRSKSQVIAEGFKMVAKTTPAKRGGEKKINPLTGKEYITKSKPASRKVRVRALKTFTQHIV